MARFAGSAGSTLLSGDPAQEVQADHRAPLWVKPHSNPRKPVDITCSRDQPLRVPKIWDLLRAPHLLLGPPPRCSPSQGPATDLREASFLGPLPPRPSHTQVGKVVVQISGFPKGDALPFSPSPPGEVCSPRGDEAHAGCLHAAGSHLHHGIYPHEPARARPVGPGNTAGGLGCVPRGLASRARGQVPRTPRVCPF